MKSNPRGLAVIINNVYFVELKTREGTEFDLKMLENLFADLGFTVDKQEDFSSDVSVMCLTSVTIHYIMLFGFLVKFSNCINIWYLIAANIYSCIRQ